MAAKFLAARFDRQTLYVSIHLDTSKLLSDGTTPDPDYVRDYRYGAPRRNSGEAAAAYRARLRAFADTQLAEARLLAQQDQAVVVPDPAGQVSLAEEGTTF